MSGRNEDDMILLHAPPGAVLIEVEPLAEERCGIFVPEEYRDRPEYRVWFGEVISVGPPSAIDADRHDEALQPADVRVGSRVLFERNSLTPLEIGQVAHVWASELILEIFEDGGDFESIDLAPKSGINHRGERI